jgi:adenylate cyclase
MGIILRLFGGVSLETENAPVTGSAAQRHRLALLALLAASPTGTVARDKLMAFLWPERDGASARKLLNQSVYALRKTCGEDAIVTVGEDLHLNRDVVRCDVEAFVRAVAAGDHVSAAGLYGGPFLDGFFLRDSPEFEAWVAGERERLAGMHGRTLEALAEQAESAGDHAGAVGWWRRRAAQDPYDARISLALMRALERAGNPAGAVQHAAIHERLLRDELGMEPAPEIGELAERLRHAKAGSAPAAESSRARPASRREGAAPAPIAPAPSGQLPDADRVAPALVAAPATPIVSRRSGRRWLRPAAGVAAGIILAGLTLGGLLMNGRRSHEAPPGDGLSLAVLPLANLSPHPDDAVLADAMTEELTTVLGKVAGLRVVPRSSVYSMRVGIDARALADSLDVSHLLEGGFQKIDTRIRMRVRLIDARRSATLWSEVYERDMEDVFAVQDELARAVARQLGIRMTAGRSPATQPTRSVAAYELYLRGNDPVMLRHDSTAREALKLFRRAVELDSTYAAAHAGIGRMQARLAAAGRVEERRLHFDLAERAVRRALELEPDLAEAHATLGMLRMAAADIKGAEHHVRRALELEPGRPITHEWMVTLEIWQGRPAQALEHARRAFDLDPLSPTANAEYARALLANDRCDEALVQLERIAVLDPPLLRAAPIAAACLGRKGRWAAAIHELRSVPAARQAQAGLLGYVLARAGERAEAERILAELLAQWQAGGGDASFVASVYAGLGNLDEAFAWLERAVDEGSFLTVPGHANHLFVSGPLFEELRSDPRFPPLLARLGFQNR